MYTTTMIYAPGKPPPSLLPGLWQLQGPSKSAALDVGHQRPGQPGWNEPCPISDCSRSRMTAAILNDSLAMPESHSHTWQHDSRSGMPRPFAIWCHEMLGHASSCTSQPDLGWSEQRSAAWLGPETCSSPNDGSSKTALMAGNQLCFESSVYHQSGSVEEKAL